MTEQNTSETAARARREGDQRIADRAAAAHRLIQTIQSDPEVTGLLAGCGCPAEQLAEGQKLYRAARAAFFTRQAALGRLRVTQDGVEAAFLDARQVYADFRAVARLLFGDRAARVALGLEGEPPEEAPVFLAVARAGYEVAARTQVYRERLSQYGSLAAARQSLDLLARAEFDLQVARSAVVRMTRLWDEAVSRLDEWAHRYCRQVRLALRDHPELIQKVGL